MLFDQQKADFICERLAEGISVREIMREHRKEQGLPSMATLFKWLSQVPEFAEQYARARETQAETLADEIIAIADDGLNDTYTDDEGNRRTDHDVIARSKLRVEARKWVAAKLLPKKYGDRVQVDNTHSFEQESTDDLLARATKYAAKLGISIPNGVSSPAAPQESSD